jgi:hypothetical protein
MYEVYILGVIIILITIVIIELWKPNIITEGFNSLVSVGDSTFWAKWVPRRGDVGVNPTDEQSGYIRDIRYFNDYTDIQRLGANQDFCRMIAEEDDPENLFFACALGGTEGLSTVKYKTHSVKDGLELSRDDYMNELGGRNGYCRILKTGESTFEAKCNAAGDHDFKTSLTTDPNPPKNIQTLLSFYEGIVFWLRFRDDMLDYAKNLTIAKSGALEIQEFPPNPEKTEGLEFNGVDQFLRIGDSKDLSFGETVQLRYLRAISFWVYFEEFTNNAHIIDFGNGAGKDNVFIGIIGRGNPGVQQEESRNSVCIDQAITTVPAPPSGQGCTEEVSPETLIKTSSANVDEWDCPAPELFGKIMKPIHGKKAKKGEAKTADLLYEIWDNKQRKLHIQVKNAIPLRKWVHITITAKNADAFKPDLQVYKNGELIHTEPGWLPQTNYTSNNYIGKSNWSNQTSPYENADELFKGKLFDIRGYRIPMNKKKVKDTYKWGKGLLGL